MPETGIDKLEKASMALTEAVTWKGENLFASAPVLEKDGKLEIVGVGTVHAPITDEWVNNYKLPITEADLRDQDPDGDNFTNLEEFVAFPKTDPTNPESHPAFITKLCLASMVESDLKLVYRAQVDPKTWQIDLVSEGKYRPRNMLVERAKRFGPSDQFRLDGFKEIKGTDPNGVPTDTSEVTISYIEAGGTARVSTVLVREEPWEMPTHEGNFLDQYDDSEFAQKRGSTFNLSSDKDNRFTIIEVTAQKAILKDQKGKDYQILPCN
jgi:hypothetical protein